VGNNKSSNPRCLEGITGLGMTVCCCNVTVTADSPKLKHHDMTLCGRGRKLIALKVCVTGVHILGWQKSSNSCVNADRSVYRSLPQWGKTTSQHTIHKKWKIVETLIHTTWHTHMKLYLTIHAALRWETCGMRAHIRNTNLMKCTDTLDLRLSFVIQLIAAGVL